METKTRNIYISDPKIVKGNFHELLSKWLELMMPFKNPELKFITTNSEILDYKYDNSRFLITDNDVERTRIIESKGYKDFEFTLKQLLVYYCDNNKIEYKQGMNEMMGILLLMKFMENDKIELYEVYNTFLLLIWLSFCEILFKLFSKLIGLIISIDICLFLLSFIDTLYFCFTS